MYRLVNGCEESESSIILGEVLFAAAPRVVLGVEVSLIACFDVVKMMDTISSLEARVGT